MSSTRIAKDDSVFHQSRYASSPEFERGLLANLVAKRCALLDDKAEIELVWFIHHLSHQPGGLAAVARELLAKFSDRIQTLEMEAMKLKHGKVCNAGQVRKIRADLPDEIAREFPLKGDAAGYVEELLDSMSNRQSRYAHQDERPRAYPSDGFVKVCRYAAQHQLEKELARICLDPQWQLTDAQPWYFPQLISTLREHKQDFVNRAAVGVAVTALGAKVYEVLDYTFYSRGLTLIEGDARRGKSFSAKAWFLQHPGQSRFVEVPSTNDDASFFRALARGLGLGNFLKYKVAEIRERVESVLLSGDLLLVLDEGQRLWPQHTLRYFFPSRINWLMAMANSGIPICVISTPQFLKIQTAVEEKHHWNSAQLTGRIRHFESLPTDLEPSDLIAVAKAFLPEADATVLRALAVYARSSDRYLAAIESIAMRARFLAMRAGRKAATTDDVRKAMQGSVIPADSKLLRALEAGRGPKMRRLASSSPDLSPASVPDESSQQPQEALPGASRIARRGIDPLDRGQLRRTRNPADLVAA